MKLNATIDSIKAMTSLLATLYDTTKGQLAVIQANETGLRVSITNKAKTLQGVAYIREHWFQLYEIEAEAGDSKEEEGLIADEEREGDNLPLLDPIRFQISLTVLLECLHVFGPANLASTKLHMTYSTLDPAFGLLIEHAGVVTECRIATMEADAELDFPERFQSDAIVSKTFFNPLELRDALLDVFDTPGGQEVTVKISQEEPPFQAVTHGESGSCQVELASSSSAFIAPCEAAEEQQVTYKTSALAFIMRGLSTASESLLQINAGGMLSLAHKYTESGRREGFVNFFAMPCGVVQGEGQEEAPPVEHEDLVLDDDSDEGMQSQQKAAKVQRRKRKK